MHAPQINRLTNFNNFTSIFTTKLSCKFNWVRDDFDNYGYVNTLKSIEMLNIEI